MQLFYAILAAHPTACASDSARFLPILRISPPYINLLTCLKPSFLYSFHTLKVRLGYRT